MRMSGERFEPLRKSLQGCVMRSSAKCGLGVGDVWLLLDKSGKQEVKQCIHINCVKLLLSQFLVLTNAQIFLHNTAPGNGGFQSTNYEYLKWMR